MASAVSTAMFVDDAHLWACTNGAFPPPMAVAAPAVLLAATSVPPHVEVVPLDPGSGALTTAPLDSGVGTLTAAPLDSGGGTLTTADKAAVLATVSPVANITRVAVAQHAQTYVGTSVNPPAAAEQTAKSGLFNRLQMQEGLKWFVIAAVIVGIFLILFWLLRRLFGTPKP